MVYEIAVSELLCKIKSVEANSRSEALRIIQDQYYNGDLVLSADDYVDGSVQFEIVGTNSQDKI